MTEEHRKMLFVIYLLLICSLSTSAISRRHVFSPLTAKSILLTNLSKTNRQLLTNEMTFTTVLYANTNFLPSLKSEYVSSGNMMQHKNKQTREF